jgi:acetate kinase
MSLDRLRDTILIREKQSHYNMSRPEIILSINAGSSSLKITLFRVKDSSSSLEQIAAAEVSGFTDPPAEEKYTRGSYSTKNKWPNIKSHNDAFQHILDGFLNDKDLREVRNKNDITHACHRVVHGGDYTTDQFINEDTYHKIKELEDLAPL